MARLYDFVAGTKIRSAQVDAEFDNVVAAHNALNAEMYGLIDTGVLSRLGVINVMDYNASGSATTTTGGITSGLKALTVASTSTFSVGQGVSVTGAGVAGSTLVTSVSAINGLVITTADAASTTVVAAVVSHDDTVAIQSAINVLSTTGGKIIIPNGTYKLSPQGGYNSCLNIAHDNISIEGMGASSILSVSVNSAIPILIKSTPDDNVSTIGTTVSNIVIEGITVKGTAVYSFYGVSRGRGILMQKVKNVTIKNCYVIDMSMIGICVETTADGVLITENIVDNCAYTSININGAVSRAIVSLNSCSNCNGSVDSCIIQVDGNHTTIGNTIYKSTGHGIMHGEGNFYGVGLIEDNFIKQCDGIGVYAIFHGSCIIKGNEIVNCKTAGVKASGSTSGTFTVANERNIIEGNIILNCLVVGIFSDAIGTNIINNQVMWKATITNSTADTTNPSYIFSGSDVGWTTTTIGIQIDGNYNGAKNNVINGCTRGFGVRMGLLLGSIYGNSGDNTFSWSWLSPIGLLANGGNLINFPTNEQTRNDTTYLRSGKNTYQMNLPFGETTFSSVLGLFETGSEISYYSVAASASKGIKVINRRDALSTVEVVGDGILDTITVDNVGAGIGATYIITAGDYITVYLDNNTPHKTTVVSINSGAKTIKLTAPIASGRKVLVGASVFTHRPVADSVLGAAIP